MTSPITLHHWIVEGLRPQGGKILLRQITELLHEIHLQGQVHKCLTPLSVTLNSTGTTVESITHPVSEELVSEWRPAEEKNSIPSKEGDIFALGCIFNLIYGGQHPFGRSGHRALFIANHLYDLSGCRDKHVRKLIGEMISHDPKRRPSCADVMSHPFLWSNEQAGKYINDIANNIDISNEQFKKWSDIILFSEQTSSVESNTSENYESVQSVAEILLKIKVCISYKNQ